MDSVFNYADRVGLDDLDKIRKHTETALRERGLDDDNCANLVLVVDEWVTNVVTHGYNDKGGEIELQIDVTNDQARICISDQGKPFDILSAEKPDLSPGVIPAGGVGIELIKRLVDELSYKQLPDDGNKTCFTKFLIPTS